MRPLVPTRFSRRVCRGGSLVAHVGHKQPLVTVRFQVGCRPMLDILKSARGLVILAILISIFGVVIHIGALFAGLSWFIFFHAPPSVVESYKAGTWLAPLGALAIAGLMGACAIYAASAIGWVRRPPLQALGLATMAAICVGRSLLLPVLAVPHPELLNTFEVVAAVVWGIAGMGFSVGLLLVTGRRMPPGGKAPTRRPF